MGDGMTDHYSVARHASCKRVDEARHSARKAQGARHRREVKIAADGSITVLHHEAASGVLLEYAEPEILNEAAHEGLPMPEPRGSEIVAVLGRRVRTRSDRADTPAQTVSRLNKTPVTAGPVELVSDAQPRKPTAHNQHISVHQCRAQSTRSHDAWSQRFRSNTSRASDVTRSRISMPSRWSIS